MIFEPSNPKEQVLARLFCGKLYLIITFICWVLLLFEFTEIGIWTYNFILNIKKKQINWGKSKINNYKKIKNYPTQFKCIYKYP